MFNSYTQLLLKCTARTSLCAFKNFLLPALLLLFIAQQRARVIKERKQKSYRILQASEDTAQVMRFVLGNDLLNWQ